MQIHGSSCILLSQISLRVHPIEEIVNIPHCIDLWLGEGGDDNKETGPIDKWLHEQHLDLTTLHIVSSLSQGHRNCTPPSSHEYANSVK